jgi:hypothetical protein
MQQWATFCTTPKQEAQNNIAPLRLGGRPKPQDGLETIRGG